MCYHCKHEDLAERINWMLGDEIYEFASDKLYGIQDWVLRNKHCTEKQKTAVNNIRIGAEQYQFMREGARYG